MTDPVPALQADGFDEAIIGVVRDLRNGQERLVYNRIQCLRVLMVRDGMSYREAGEFFDFNVAGAYMGEGTPLFLDPYDKTTINEDFTDD